MEFIHQMEPSIDHKEIDAVSEYLKSNPWLTEFKKTEEFESLICQYSKAKHCIIVNNGTVSLTLALQALNVKAGDEVIVPDLSMIATPNSAVMFGATIKFVDVEKDTLCMDINKAKDAITNKTKALIYVSLNGRSGDLNAVRKLCDDHNIAMLEDSAQSLGSFYNQKHLGTFGHIGSISFSSQKIITTGQGGALITNDDGLAVKLRKLKDFGRVRAGIDIHEEIGYNFKFTDLLAVIGCEQMKKLNDRVKRKKEIYSLYAKELGNIKEIEFVPVDLSRTAPWFVDVYINNPDELQSYLKENKIGSRRVYPPMHSQKAYAEYNHLQFPVTEYYSTRGLWLPSSSNLSDEKIKYICDTIKKFYNH